MTAGATEQACPQCGTMLPVHYGYVTWCHNCGWNVTAPELSDVSRTRFDRLYASVGRRLGDRLVAELLRARDLEPRLTLTRAAAFAIAASVHLAMFTLVAGAVLVVLLSGENPAAIVLAVLMVMLAVLMRPRFGSVPDEDIVTPEQAPTLHRVAGEIAAALDVRPPDLIVIDHEFN